MINFLKPKKNIFSFDSFYLTYDEPEKDERFSTVKQLIPNLKNVDGIKGFNNAHKACASLANTNYVTIIDGDNSFIKHPDSIKIPKNLFDDKCVLSFSSQNSINNLIYGNGGVKCWPRDVLLFMRSHEEASDQKAVTDFCFTIPYYQLPHVITNTNIHLSPYQAFRAGYREGVKMCLDNGIPFDHTYDIFQRSQKQNLYRLKVWCQVGRDIDNGIWAIYGARLGAYTTLTTPDRYSQIQDYDYLSKLWHDVISLVDPEKEAKLLLKLLNSRFYLELGELAPLQSIAFKKIIKNPRREGPMTL